MELLIVITIMTMVSAFAVPNLKTFFNKSKTDAIASQLLQAIHAARTLAISSHQLTILCGSENAKNCSATWHQGYVISSAEKIYYTFLHIAHDGFLYWRAFPKGRNDVEFLSNGKLNAENGTFWYCVPHNLNPLFAIPISQNGRARIIYPNAKGEVVMKTGETLECS